MIVAKREPTSNSFRSHREIGPGEDEDDKIWLQDNGRLRLRPRPRPRPRLRLNESSQQNKCKYQSSRNNKANKMYITSVPIQEMRTCIHLFILILTLSVSRWNEVVKCEQVEKGSEDEMRFSASVILAPNTGQQNWTQHLTKLAATKLATTTTLVDGSSTSQLVTDFNESGHVYRRMAHEGSTRKFRGDDVDVDADARAKFQHHQPKKRNKRNDNSSADSRQQRQTKSASSGGNSNSSSQFLASDIRVGSSFLRQANSSQYNRQQHRQTQLKLANSIALLKPKLHRQQTNVENEIGASDNHDNADKRQHLPVSGGDAVEIAPQQRDNNNNSSSSSGSSSSSLQLHKIDPLQEANVSNITFATDIASDQRPVPESRSAGASESQPLVVTLDLLRRLPEASNSSNATGAAASVSAKDSTFGLASSSNVQMHSQLQATDSYAPQKEFSLAVDESDQQQLIGAHNYIQFGGQHDEEQVRQQLPADGIQSQIGELGYDNSNGQQISSPLSISFPAKRNLNATLESQAKLKDTMIQLHFNKTLGFERAATPDALASGVAAAAAATVVATNMSYMSNESHLLPLAAQLNGSAGGVRPAYESFVPISGEQANRGSISVAATRAPENVVEYLNKQTTDILEEAADEVHQQRQLSNKRRVKQQQQQQQPVKQKQTDQDSDSNSWGLRKSAGSELNEARLDPANSTTVSVYEDIMTWTPAAGPAAYRAGSGQQQQSQSQSQQRQQIELQPKSSKPLEASSDSFSSSKMNQVLDYTVESPSLNSGGDFEQMGDNIEKQSAFSNEQTAEVSGKSINNNNRASTNRGRSAHHRGSSIAGNSNKKNSAFSAPAIEYMANETNQSESVVARPHSSQNKKKRHRVKMRVVKKTKPKVSIETNEHSASAQQHHHNSFNGSLTNHTLGAKKDPASEESSDDSDDDEGENENENDNESEDEEPDEVGGGGGVGASRGQQETSNDEPTHSHLVPRPSFTKSELPPLPSNQKRFKTSYSTLSTDHRDRSRNYSDQNESGPISTVGDNTEEANGANDYDHTQYEHVSANSNSNTRKKKRRDQSRPKVKKLSSSWPTSGGLSGNSPSIHWSPTDTSAKSGRYRQQGTKELPSKDSYQLMSNDDDSRQEGSTVVGSKAMNDEIIDDQQQQQQQQQRQQLQHPAHQLRYREEKNYQLGAAVDSRSKAPVIKTFRLTDGGADPESSSNMLDSRDVYQSHQNNRPLSTSSNFELAPVSRLTHQPSVRSVVPPISMAQDNTRAQHSMSVSANHWAPQPMGGFVPHQGPLFGSSGIMHQTRTRSTNQYPIRNQNQHRTTQMSSHGNQFVAAQSSFDQPSQFRPIVTGFPQHQQHQTTALRSPDPLNQRLHYNVNFPQTPADENVRMLFNEYGNQQSAQSQSQSQSQSNQPRFSSHTYYPTTSGGNELNLEIGSSTSARFQHQKQQQPFTSSYNQQELNKMQSAESNKLLRPQQQTSNAASEQPNSNTSWSIVTLPYPQPVTNALSYFSLYPNGEPSSTSSLATQPVGGKLGINSDDSQGKLQTNNWFNSAESSSQQSTRVERLSEQQQQQQEAKQQQQSLKPIMYHMPAPQLDSDKQQQQQGSQNFPDIGPTSTIAAHSGTRKVQLAQQKPSSISASNSATDNNNNSNSQLLTINLKTHAAIGPNQLFWEAAARELAKSASKLEPGKVPISNGHLPPQHREVPQSVGPNLPTMRRPLSTLRFPLNQDPMMSGSSQTTNGHAYAGQLKTPQMAAAAFMETINHGIGFNELAQLHSMSGSSYNPHELSYVSHQNFIPLSIGPPASTFDSDGFGFMSVAAAMPASSFAVPPTSTTNDLGPSFNSANGANRNANSQFLKKGSGAISAALPLATPVSVSDPFGWPMGYGSDAAKTLIKVNHVAPPPGYLVPNKVTVAQANALLYPTIIDPKQGTSAPVKEDPSYIVQSTIGGAQNKPTNGLAANGQQHWPSGNSDRLKSSQQNMMLAQQSVVRPTFHIWPAKNQNQNQNQNQAANEPHMTTLAATSSAQTKNNAIKPNFVQVTLSTRPPMSRRVRLWQRLRLFRRPKNSTTKEANAVQRPPSLANSARKTPSPANNGRFKRGILESVTNLLKRKAPNSTLEHTKSSSLSHKAPLQVPKLAIVDMGIGGQQRQQQQQNSQVSDGSNSAFIPLLDNGNMMETLESDLLAQALMFNAKQEQQQQQQQQQQQLQQAPMPQYGYEPRPNVNPMISSQSSEKESLEPFSSMQVASHLPLTSQISSTNIREQHQVHEVAPPITSAEFHSLMLSAANSAPNDQSSMAYLKNLEQQLQQQEQSLDTLEPPANQPNGVLKVNKQSSSRERLKQLSRSFIKSSRKPLTKLMKMTHLTSRLPGSSGTSTLAANNVTASSGSQQQQQQHQTIAGPASGSIASSSQQQISVAQRLNNMVSPSVMMAPPSSSSLDNFNRFMMPIQQWYHFQQAQMALQPVAEGAQPRPGQAQGKIIAPNSGLSTQLLPLASHSTQPLSPYSLITTKPSGLSQTQFGQTQYQPNRQPATNSNPRQTFSQNSQSLPQATQLNSQQQHYYGQAQSQNSMQVPQIRFSRPFPPSAQVTHFNESANQPTPVSTTNVSLENPLTAADEHSAQSLSFAEPDTSESNRYFYPDAISSSPSPSSPAFDSAPGSSLFNFGFGLNSSPAERIDSGHFPSPLAKAISDFQLYDLSLMPLVKLTKNLDLFQQATANGRPEGNHHVIGRPPKRDLLPSLLASSVRRASDTFENARLVHSQGDGNNVRQSGPNRQNFVASDGQQNVQGGNSNSNWQRVNPQQIPQMQQSNHLLKGNNIVQAPGSGNILLTRPRSQLRFVSHPGGAKMSPQDNLNSLGFSPASARQLRDMALQANDSSSSSSSSLTDSMPIRNTIRYTDAEIYSPELEPSAKLFSGPHSSASHSVPSGSSHSTNGISFDTSGLETGDFNSLMASASSPNEDLQSILQPTGMSSFQAHSQPTKADQQTVNSGENSSNNGEFTLEQHQQFQQQLLNQQNQQQMFMPNLGPTLPKPRLPKIIPSINSMASKFRQHLYQTFPRLYPLGSSSSRWPQLLSSASFMSYPKFQPANYMVPFNSQQQQQQQQQSIDNLMSSSFYNLANSPTHDGTKVGNQMASAATASSNSNGAGTIQFETQPQFVQKQQYQANQRPRGPFKLVSRPGLNPMMHQHQQQQHSHSMEKQQLHQVATGQELQLDGSNLLTNEGQPIEEAQIVYTDSEKPKEASRPQQQQQQQQQEQRQAQQMMEFVSTLNGSISPSFEDEFQSSGAETSVYDQEAIIDQVAIPSSGAEQSLAGNNSSSAHDFNNAQLVDSVQSVILNQQQQQQQQQLLQSHPNNPLHNVMTEMTNNLVTSDGTYIQEEPSQGESALTQSVPPTIHAQAQKHLIRAPAHSHLQHIQRPIQVTTQLIRNSSTGQPTFEASGANYTIHHHHVIATDDTANDEQAQMQTQLQRGQQQIFPQQHVVTTTISKKIPPPANTSLHPDPSSTTGTSVETSESGPFLSDEEEDVGETPPATVLVDGDQTVTITPGGQRLQTISENGTLENAIQYESERVQTRPRFQQQLSSSQGSAEQKGLRKTFSNQRQRFRQNGQSDLAKSQQQHQQQHVRQQFVETNEQPLQQQQQQQQSNADYQVIKASPIESPSYIDGQAAPGSYIQLANGTVSEQQEFRLSNTRRQPTTHYQGELIPVSSSGDSSSSGGEVSEDQQQMPGQQLYEPEAGQTVLFASSGQAGTSNGQTSQDVTGEHVYIDGSSSSRASNNQQRHSRPQLIKHQHHYKSFSGNGSTRIANNDNTLEYDFKPVEANFSSMTTMANAHSASADPEEIQPSAPFKPLLLTTNNSSSSASRPFDGLNEQPILVAGNGKTPDRSSNQMVATGSQYISVDQPVLLASGQLESPGGSATTINQGTALTATTTPSANSVNTIQVQERQQLNGGDQPVVFVNVKPEKVMQQQHHFQPRRRPLKLPKSAQPKSQASQWQLAAAAQQAEGQQANSSHLVASAGEQAIVAGNQLGSVGSASTSSSTVLAGISNSGAASQIVLSANRPPGERLNNKSTSTVVGSVASVSLASVQNNNQENLSNPNLPVSASVTVATSASSTTTPSPAALITRGSFTRPPKAKIRWQGVGQGVNRSLSGNDIRQAPNDAQIVATKLNQVQAKSELSSSETSRSERAWIVGGMTHQTYAPPANRGQPTGQPIVSASSTNSSSGSSSASTNTAAIISGGPDNSELGQSTAKSSPSGGENENKTTVGRTNHKQSSSYTSDDSNVKQRSNSTGSSSNFDSTASAASSPTTIPSSQNIEQDATTANVYSQFGLQSSSASLSSRQPTDSSPPHKSRFQSFRSGTSRTAPANHRPVYAASAQPTGAPVTSRDSRTASTSFRLSSSSGLSGLLMDQSASSSSGGSSTSTSQSPQLPAPVNGVGALNSSSSTNSIFTTPPMDQAPNSSSLAHRPTLFSGTLGSFNSLRDNPSPDVEVALSSASSAPTIITTTSLDESKSLASKFSPRSGAANLSHNLTSLHLEQQQQQQQHRSQSTQQADLIQQTTDTPLTNTENDFHQHHLNDENSSMESERLTSAQARRNRRAEKVQPTSAVPQAASELDAVQRPRLIQLHPVGGQTDSNEMITLAAVGSHGLSSD